MQIKKYEEIIERIDCLVDIGESDNEAIYIKFKLIDLKNLNETNSLYFFELFILLSNAILYDYIFRTDTKTYTKYLNGFDITNKTDYKFVRNLILKKNKVVKETNFEVTETMNNIEYEFENEMNCILDVELNNLTAEFIDIHHNKITINKDKFILFCMETIENFICYFIHKSDTLLENHAQNIAASVKARTQFFLKAVKGEEISSGYVKYVKKNVVFDDQDYYDQMYVCFILKQMIKDNLINEQYIIVLFDNIFNGESENIKYSGNAFYNLTLIDGSKYPNNSIVKYMRKYDYYSLKDDKKQKHSEFFAKYEVEGNVERKDLYKNYYLNNVCSMLVSLDLIKF